MPYLIEQICLKVIHKAQNNAKDSKGTKARPCAHVTSYKFSKINKFEKKRHNVEKRLIFRCI